MDRSISDKMVLRYHEVTAYIKMARIMMQIIKRARVPPYLQQGS
ncbi:MAG: hypothetical protein ACREBA_01345 [Nitrosotalea sp.]